MYLPFKGETKRLNQGDREGTRGHFIQLSEGQTHYQILGPDDGRLIILVHGIAGPMEIWDPLAQSLVDCGFRVLYYDLFGRGYSDRPNVKYDIDLFTSQLSQLLSKLTTSNPFALIGWSLGGIITTTWVAENPAWSGRIALIAPAGIEVKLPLISAIGMVPILGDLIMSAFGRRIVLQSLMRGLHSDIIKKSFLSLITEQMQYRGYLHAFLSTLRNCAYKDFSHIYREIGEGVNPVLLLLGSNDPSIPLSLKDKMRELIPRIEQFEVKDSGHFPHLERTNNVSSKIVRFLNSPS